MASPPRIEEVGLTYHVNTVAVAGLRAYPDDLYRDKFMSLFRVEIEESEWVCLGYTVLGTHYHVIIRLKKLTLSSGFQRLNSRFARWFNEENGRRGAVWQARFHAEIVESDSHFMELQRYLAYNAPRANLAERPEDWAHCSYGAMIGLYPSDPYVEEDEVLGLLSSNTKHARALLKAFVEERDPRVRRRMLLPPPQRRL